MRSMFALTAFVVAFVFLDAFTGAAVPRMMVVCLGSLLFAAFWWASFAWYWPLAPGTSFLFALDTFLMLFSIVVFAAIYAGAVASLVHWL